MNFFPDDHDWETPSQAILDELYRLPQSLVAASVMALREGAIHMLGERALDLDLFGSEGAEALGDGWDVLQNYAEQCFDLTEPRGHGVLDRQLIDASYDPAWRVGMREWALQNADLLRGNVTTWPRAFHLAAAMDVDGYAEELRAGSESLEGAVLGGRLPCSLDVAVNLPDLAREAMALWRVLSADSPMYSDLVSQDPQVEEPGVSLDEAETPTDETLRVRPRMAPAEPQKLGADLEVNVLTVFEPLVSIGRDEVARINTELRRQRSGTQYGTDIVFRATAVGSESTCLIECKNYTSPLTVNDVAGKLAQAEAAYDDEPVDHWILVSPHQEPSNELDQLVQKWNRTQRYPFTVQVWSPQSGVRELFGAVPNIYRKVYGHEPDPVDVEAVLTAFGERLHPRPRLPDRLRRYIGDLRSYVLPSELRWIDELPWQIERYGYDEAGTPLTRPLRDVIVSTLDAVSARSPVALLLGDFGEGKSFFTVSLCAVLRDRYLARPSNDALFPVRLFLKGYRHISSSADFLRSQLELIGLGMEEWAELAQRQKPLVILDGLDEMSVRQDSRTLRSNLDKIGSLLEMLEGMPVLVTSRPQFLASTQDRERFFDRLRRPHVYRIAQPDRRETVAHLRSFAGSRDLEAKLSAIKELYDPIGLAGKVLFLEMLKATLPDLPDDHFDELVLYETYVDASLRRKIELLRDPSSALVDSELISQMKLLLEKVAVAIHVSGEGAVDLNEFVATEGGAARILWSASKSDEGPEESHEDATARIGSRSLLKRVEEGASQLQADGGPGDRWLVDFFHRSMKEYFVAQALRRALSSPDPFAAVRELLKGLPLQAEIVGFFKLFGTQSDSSVEVLSSLAHSARVGAGQGLLGSGAISLYAASGGVLRGGDWQRLDLDGALLSGVDLSEGDFRRSTMRGADLSVADLSSADLRAADLTDANLDAGGSVIAISPDVAPKRFIALTEEGGLGRISLEKDVELTFLFLPLSHQLRWPRSVFALGEDLYLIVGHGEALIATVQAGSAAVVTQFRISNDIQDATLVASRYLGLVLEAAADNAVAIFIEVATGEAIWQHRVAPGGQAYAWDQHGLAVLYNDVLRVYEANGSDRKSSCEPNTIRALSRLDDVLGVAWADGGVSWTSVDGDWQERHRLGKVHQGAGTAVLVTQDGLLSAGSDGSLAVIAHGDSGGALIGSRIERQLRCAGARVNELRGDREKAIFISNGAVEL